MSKKFLLCLITTVSIMLPFGAFAATPDAATAKQEKISYKIDISKLNAQQKADLQAQMIKMMELRKETVQKMVANGAMTAEQGKAAVQRIDERIKSIKAGNLQLDHKNKKGMNGKGHCGDKDDSDKKNDSAKGTKQ